MKVFVSFFFGWRDRKFLEVNIYFDLRFFEYTIMNKTIKFIVLCKEIFFKNSKRKKFHLKAGKLKKIVSFLSNINEKKIKITNNRNI